MAYTLGKAVVRAPGRVASAQNVESMSPEAKFFAHLSNVSYREPAARPRHQNEFDLDSEFNTERIVVYTRGWLRVKVAIVAFRGTSNLTDVLADVQLAGNTDVNRMKQLLAKEVDCITAVSRKYPGARIHVTGHSLGGTIAMFVTVHTGLIFGGHIFNPGAGFKSEELVIGGVAAMLGFGTGAVLGPLGVSVAAGALASTRELSHDSYGVGQVQELASRIKTHHIFGDVLSMLFDLGDVFCYTPAQMNFHTLANFLCDDAPSTESIFRFDSFQNPSKMRSSKKMPSSAARRRSVEPKSQIRSGEHRGTCERRTHSHTGTSGETEDGHGDDASNTSVDELPGLVIEEEHVWRSALDVGSKVEVLAHAEAGQRRPWVQAEVVAAFAKVLTLEWFCCDDGGGTRRRVARNSTEMRACISSEGSTRELIDDAGSEEENTSGSPTTGQHVHRADANLRKKRNATGSARDARLRQLIGSCAEDICGDSSPTSESSPWHRALRVGSVAEVLVKKEWVPAEVVIARGKVVTMKWIDSQDGAEVLRRVARDSTDLRPRDD